MRSFIHSVPIVLLAIIAITSGARWNRWRKHETKEPTTSTTWATSSTSTSTSTSTTTTEWPTAYPTPQPTNDPTPSPLTPSCKFEYCAEIAMIVDNTGGLSDGCCETQLDNIAELLSSFKGNNKHDNPRVAYVEVNAEGADVVIPLHNNLNDDIREYTSFIRSRECGSDEGQTNLDAGMIAALEELIFNGNNEDCIQKIVIVMNCDTNDRQVICENAPNVLQDRGIEVIQINALGAECGIHKPRDYLDCIGNDICVVDDLRDDSEWRKCIDEQQDAICKTPTTTTSTTTTTTTAWPTPNPTPWPTPLPTPWPTAYPTKDPTEGTTTTVAGAGGWDTDSDETTTTGWDTTTTTEEDDDTTTTESDDTTTTTEYLDTTTTTEEDDSNDRNNGYNNNGHNGRNNGGDNGNNHREGNGHNGRNNGHDNGNNDEGSEDSETFHAWRRR